MIIIDADAINPDKWTARIAISDIAPGTLTSAGSWEFGVRVGASDVYRWASTGFTVSSELLPLW
jgi:hypothetical protein